MEELEIQYPDGEVFLGCFKQGAEAENDGKQPVCPYAWGTMGAGAWTAGLFMAKEVRKIRAAKAAVETI